MTEILLIGCGNMGYAMLTGWLAMTDAPEVRVIEPAAPLRDRAAATGAMTYETAADLPADFRPDLVVLAVKPQVMPKILPDYAHLNQACFVSIAAGTTLATLAAGLGDVAIIRCMPNTPAAVGKGVFGICANDRTSPAQLDLVKTLLAVSGTVLAVATEDDIDRITAISGSGPAYLFHFIEALAEAGRRIGLPEEIATAAARGTVFGAAALAEQASEDAAQLRRNVTSPNGTTAAALEILMGNDAQIELVSKAAQAAFDRAQELAKSEG